VTTLSPSFVLAYALLSIFTFYATWHVKHFRGASRVFELLLIYFATAATIAQYGTYSALAFLGPAAAAAGSLGRHREVSSTIPDRMQ